MSIQQISFANTFNDLVNVASSLIVTSNNLTDGPVCIANTELHVPFFNVQTTAIVSGNLSCNNSLQTNNVHVTGVGTSSNVTGTALVVSCNANFANIQTLLTTTLQTPAGTATLDVVDISTLNATSLITPSINASSGNATLSSANVTNLVVTDGSVTLTNINSSTANIITLKANVSNSNIEFSTIHDTTVSNCSFNTISGLTKNDVGLGNVDDTSDATKNSATANLSNKTLMSPLIITGNVSSDPTTDMGIASKNYVDNNHPEKGSPIINGNMDVWQRGNSANAISQGSGGRLVADMWLVGCSQTIAVVDGNKSADVPTVANAGILLTNSLEVRVRTANTGIDPTDISMIQTSIEGYNWKSFAQKDCTMSFWVFSTKTGTYSMSFYNIGDINGNQVLTKEYSINTANTWEYKTVFIPASPSAGTWDYTNQKGLTINFVLAVGSGFTQNANSWIAQNGVRFGTNNQVNFLSDANNYFRLTGVKLEVGNTATPLQFRSFADELALCRRYYQKSFPYSIAPTSNTGILTLPEVFVARTSGANREYCPTVRLQTTMRIPPTITFYNPTSIGSEATDIDAGGVCSSTHTDYVSEYSFNISTIGNASTSIGNRLAVHWAAVGDM